jgi:aspartyl-tRNA(Asn)/glutamyl-tRNA(Gln) amidotransferase subunit C
MIKTISRITITMNVDNDLLKKLEKLSNLEIAEDKREETIAQLQNVLSFVENISDVDTSDESTKFTMSQNATRLRADEAVSSTAIADDILSHAPKSDNHSFSVPKIIE